MTINDPDVVADVTAAFHRYETALVGNDVATLNELFWQSPLTLRFGLFENLYGYDEIAGFRQGRPTVDLSRTLKNTIITTYGRDYATANTEFVRHGSGRSGRQSHTWLRIEDGWRIVAAHVSWLTAPPSAS
jgi:hypothetical protein